MVKKVKRNKKFEAKKRGLYEPRFDAGGSKGLERAYICDKCDKVFRRKNNLKQHWDTHLKDKQTFPCEVSGKMLSKLSHLRRHVKNVHTALEECSKLATYTTIETNVIISTINRPNTEEAEEYYQCDCINDVSENSDVSTTCNTAQCCNVASKIECDPKQCSPHCQNQNFQNANSIRILHTKITKSKGCGLFTAETIPPNTFIIEYLGEVITAKEMNDRFIYSVENGERYDYHVRISKNVFIDSKKYGNLSRFINHSCRPNSRLEKWTVYSKERGEDIRLGFFSNRMITPNEEITFDYKWNSKTKCYCQSDNCRHFI